MEEQRNAVKEAFFLLREHFPGLPNELRDFQVESLACERLESLIAKLSLPTAKRLSSPIFPCLFVVVVRPAW